VTMIAMFRRFVCLVLAFANYVVDLVCLKFLFIDDLVAVVMFLRI